MKRRLPNRYSRAVRKYLKFKTRLEQQIKNGRFARFTKYKRQELLHRLERYRRRLAHVAGATAATSLGVFMPNISQAQTFCDNAKNPLEVFFNDSRTAVELADLDGDGDLDAFGSAKDGAILYYENIGDRSNPAFIRINRAESPFPFDGPVTGFKGAYSAVDIDGDGDLDIFAGEKYAFDDNMNGKVFFYENIGDANDAIFEQRFDEDNPLNLVDVGDEALPFLTDLDADGDLDAVVGSDDGTISYFENIGTSNTPSFEERIDVANPFDGIDVGRVAAPDLADIDEDGDLDLVVGEYYGTLKYYENVGNAAEGIFEERIGDENPVVNIQTSYFALPNIVDIDDDGDLDLLISQYASYTGTVVYYENKAACLPESIDGFVSCEAANPFAGIDVGAKATPDFADLDQDGDFDAVVGESNGTLKIFENRGTLNRPRFRERVLLDNPFNGSISNPDLIDLDGDGDLDVAIGQGDGSIKYYENLSTAEELIFEEKVGTENPFDGVRGTVTGRSAAISLVDLDGDDDLDLVLNGFGTLNYFENIGNAQQAVFERQDAKELFKEVKTDFVPKPELVDFDQDGDFDLFVSDYNKCIFYYENVGNQQNPAFEVRGGKSNPFNFSVDRESNPTFVDIDGDGDVDAFVGQEDGTIEAYKNTTLSAEAFVTDCNKEEGDLVLEIESEEEAGPYIISNAFSATIGKRNQIMASASVPIADLEDGLYVFEITPKGNLCDIKIVTSAKVGEDCEVEDRSFEIKALDTQVNLDVFPNPTANIMNYDVNRLNLEYIYVVDQLGRVVKSTRQIDGQLDISDLASGTYILVLESKTELIREVIVKHD